MLDFSFFFFLQERRWFSLVSRRSPSVKVCMNSRLLNLRKKDFWQWRKLSWRSLALVTPFVAQTASAGLDQHFSVKEILSSFRIQFSGRSQDVFVGSMRAELEDLRVHALWRVGVGVERTAVLRFGQCTVRTQDWSTCFGVYRCGAQP